MKYKPINCSFYDILEATATLRNTVEIKYLLDEEVIITHSEINNIYSKTGQEFMELNSGIIIRLDQIISVDNNLLKDFCK